MTAAAVVARREKRVVAAFRAAGATSPGAARMPGELGVLDSRIVARLQERAVLRPTAPGAYYLDEPSWEALQRMRQRIALVILCVALAILAVVFLGKHGALQTP